MNRKVIYKTMFEYAFISFAILLMDVGIYVFKFPNHFSFGGVSGLAVVLNEITGVAPGLINLVINFVLLIIGFFVLGKGFGIKTTYATVLSSVILSVMEVLFLPLHQLGYPLLVGKERPCEARTVQPAGGNGFRGRIGIQTAGTYNRNLYEFFDMFHIGKVTVFRHIYRGMGPIPGIVSAVVTVQHIIAGILQILYSPLGFLHIPSDFRIILLLLCLAQP